MESFHQVRGDVTEDAEGEKSRIAEKQIGVPEAAESVKTEEPAAAGETAVTGEETAEHVAETDVARAEIAEGAEAEQAAAKAETEDVE